MPSFKSISFIAFGIIIGLLGVALNKPDTFRVERSVVIKAPAEKVFPLINDLHNFIRWSPYDKRDPAMQRTFSGADNGVGAVYAWAGNNDVGVGQMQIINTLVPSRIVMQLDFSQPLEAHNSVEFLIAPQPDGTRVMWAMEGPLPFASKLMSIFFNIDTMVGQDFEQGLANLKTLAEQ